MEENILNKLNTINLHGKAECFSPNKKPIAALVSSARVCELIVVILLTGAAFMRAKGAALAERGYEAFGGEYLLLLLPVLYYAGKRTAFEWLSDIRELRRDRDNG